MACADDLGDPAEGMASAPLSSILSFNLPQVASESASSSNNSSRRSCTEAFDLSGFICLNRATAPELGCSSGSHAITGPGASGIQSLAICAWHSVGCRSRYRSGGVIGSVKGAERGGLLRTRHAVAAVSHTLILVAAF